VNGFELERFVHQRLLALPTPRAPHTLMPRVVAAARAWAERPWYARDWFTWPVGWQLGSIALLLVTLVAGLGVVPALPSWIVSLTPVSFTVGVHVPQFAADMAVSARTLRVIWQGLVQPLLPYAFVIVVLMCSMCAALGFALNRVVSGRTLYP
jgi:hypothetical protein